MPLNPVILVRHDKSKLNSSGYIQGQTDTPLEPGYRTRIYRLTDIVVREEGITPTQVSHIYIFCSDIGRTYHTGDRIHRRLLDKHNIKSELRFTELLNERGQGVLEEVRYEEALPRLSTDPNLSPDAETIYGFLYLSNNVPNGERHEIVKSRLEQFVRDYIHQLHGIGIISAHSISGMNYLNNILINGDMLSQPYQHYPNLSVVSLSLDPQNLPRYMETRYYGAPIHKDNWTR